MCVCGGGGAVWCGGECLREGLGATGAVKISRINSGNIWKSDERR